MAGNRPNIVLIVTDQQRFDTIAALGFDFMETPNLDRLVREGVSFTNCHITAPSCAPARASLFTGYYPHTTGILKNGDRWTRSWVENLSASGYHCVNVGKMHTTPFETPLGFHERYVVENKDRYLEGRYYFDEWDKALRARGHVKQQRELYRRREDYGESLGAFDWELPADLHSDNFVGDFAAWWLRCKPKPDGPLFLQVGFPGPHPPYDPTPDFAGRYLQKDLPIQPVTAEEIAGQPPPFQEMRQHNSQVDHDSVVHLLEPTPQQRQRQRAYYLANVSMIDEKIGELLQALEEKGYLEDAVVIFTSDHGDCLGDHGHSQKWTMYDTITRVPAIVWAPGRFTPGRSLDQLCSLFDFGPTILELAGLNVPDEFEAASLLPALEGRTWQGRDAVFAEHSRDGLLPTDYMTMVRTAEWKLVHFLDEPFGQLFDLASDPHEIHNLWDDPIHTGQKQELLERLLAWRIRSGLNAKDWNRNCR
ncbi:MAG: sulfatase-like hydrolase/transferase [Caldilineaceae bacterium]|nr:sulfatase-like hydrolase/transferase [Caldilineaceae bacterium]MDE0183479.1 sulfatase-like hydrolase/transferase [Caldilineaceae bacterium]